MDALFMSVTGRGRGSLGGLWFCQCVCVCVVEVNVNTALLLRKQKVEQWTGAGRGEDLRLPGGHVPSPR